MDIPIAGDGEGAPVVLQLFQEVDDRKAEDVYLCIRADLFKVGILFIYPLFIFYFISDKNSKT